MGMYTELELSVTLDYDKRDEFLDILRFMADGSETLPKPDKLPEHDLFFTERWDWMMNSSSFYFSCPNPVAELYVDESIQLITLTVLFNVKNYANEIENFCDWLNPYVEGAEDYPVFGGYHRYEEEDDPTLIYFAKDKPKFVKVSS